MTFEEGCALPVVATTMIDAFRRAALRRGEKILIQTAAGGTGLIAVQLARHYGAEIYATAGSQEKVDYLRSLGVAHVVDYMKEDFEVWVQRVTGSKGVDAVINTLPGDALQKGLNCLAPGGRYIEIAMVALRGARSVDLSVLTDNQTFHSVDLFRLSGARPDLLAEYRREMLELAERGVIRATVGAIFPFDQIKDAYRKLEDRRNIGKVVVRVTNPYCHIAPRAYGLLDTSARQISHSPSMREPIAIIGMSGRFAATNSLDELWAQLASGTEVIDEVRRWPLDGACRRGGLLEDISRFDPLFFNISGVEAAGMDPQQRVFLEEAWAALEDAGYAGRILDGTRCGVYVGAATGDYGQLLKESISAQAFWGGSGAIIPARISYFLNLRGPAIAVDTACSSSLVAVHLACHALWSGEVSLALAGGVFLMCTPKFYAQAGGAGMLSSSGRCRAFDAAADGFVPGEGAGVVVLKRFSDAVCDGDQLHGLIRGSAINQDGATNGITAPSGLAQERLEREVYETFGINPDDIQMMEAHGTGTRLGDPIEYQALTKAFRAYTGRRNFCAIGSVKSNIGHAAMAAGVAGMIKVLLAFQASANSAQSAFRAWESARIEFASSPFFVNTTLLTWMPAPGKKRCAAVSSFGFSGTNAHAVLEEAPARVRTHAPRPAYLVVLSARTAKQLREQVERLAHHCESTDELDCGNASYTLLIGRRHLGHRLACVAIDTGGLRDQLRLWLRGEEVQDVYEGVVDEARRRPATENVHSDGYFASIDRSEYLQNLGAAASLYIQGYEPNIAELFPAGEYCRVQLPTYPFSRDSYWPTVSSNVRPRTTPEAGSQSTPLVPSTQEIQAGIVTKPDQDPLPMQFVEEWRPTALLTDETRAPPRTVVVFLSDMRLQTPLRQALSRRDERVRVVFVRQESSDATAFGASQTVVSVRRTIDQDYGAVLARVNQAHGEIDAIWYLWPLEDDSCIHDHGPIVRLVRGIAAARASRTRLLLCGEYVDAVQRCHLDSWIGYERSLKRVLSDIEVAMVHGPRPYPAALDERAMAKWVERWAERLPGLRRER